MVEQQDQFGGLVAIVVEQQDQWGGLVASVVEQQDQWGGLVACVVELQGQCGALRDMCKCACLAPHLVDKVSCRKVVRLHSGR